MLFFEDLTEGQSDSMSRTFSLLDVNEFIKMSGDRNRIHWDRDYAANTPFKQPIVHGVLVLSVASALLGYKFPGEGSVASSMDVAFLAPVYPGDEVTATTSVLELRPPNRARMVIDISVGERTVVVGSAMVTMPTKKK